MNHKPIHITGIGLATALGTTPQSTWNALMAGRYITDNSRVPIQVAAEMPRVHALARLVAQQAIGSSDFTNRAGECALVVGTSKGAVETWMSPPRAGLSRNEFCGWGLSSIATDLCSAIAMPFAMHATLSGACASGLHALIHAAMLIRGGVVRRALIVAAESSLHPLFLASFNRMGVLAEPVTGCRPFDNARAGFLVSEAAAAVTLELDDVSNASNITPLAMIERFATAGDAHHLTGAAPQACTLRRVLREILGSTSVDLVHSHGTGTISNDPVELDAIQNEVHQDTPAYVYSHKGALGHSLGASGLVAVVLNCMAHRHQRFLPNVRTTCPIPHSGLLLKCPAGPYPVRRSIAIAQGFGGAIAGLSLTSGD